MSSPATWLYRGRLKILRVIAHDTERGDRDFYLSRSHYTDIDPTSKERAAKQE